MIGTPRPPRLGPVFPITPIATIPRPMRSASTSTKATGRTASAWDTLKFHNQIIGDTGSQPPAINPFPFAEIAFQDTSLITGPNYLAPQQTFQSNKQIKYDASRVWGAHIIRFGATVNGIATGGFASFNGLAPATEFVRELQSFEPRRRANLSFLFLQSCERSQCAVQRVRYQHRRLSLYRRVCGQWPGIQHRISCIRLSCWRFVRYQI